MNEYIVEKKLGSGTCTFSSFAQLVVGSVFLVRSRKDGCLYALKQVRVNENDASRDEWMWKWVVEDNIRPSRETSINQFLLDNATQDEQSFFVNMKRRLERSFVR